MSQKIIVIISNGCADVLEKPDNIELEIRDYDVETIDAKSDSRCKKDKDGDWYQEMIFEPISEPKELIEETKSIGWQPYEEDFPAGLQTFEVYEDLEMGKGCHPEVKNWLEIFEGMIEKPIIIPSDN